MFAIHSLIKTEIGQRLYEKKFTLMFLNINRFGTEGIRSMQTILWTRV